jgi:hypothetical protein
MDCLLACRAPGDVVPAGGGPLCRLGRRRECKAFGDPQGHLLRNLLHRARWVANEKMMTLSWEPEDNLRSCVKIVDRRFTWASVEAPSCGCLVSHFQLSSCSPCSGTTKNKRDRHGGPSHSC